MSKVLITKSLLDDLADAVASKTSEATPMTISDMTDAVEGIAEKTSSDLTASGRTVTVPAGLYKTQATKSIAQGTAGTPTATKGSVSNNSISVTPSVTNTTGYITGSTKTGTAVSVTASELVSGTKSISENGTGIDVTNYASVDVAVPSSAPTLQTKTKTYTPTESQQTETITPDTGYDGLDEVDITVNAVSSSYVGTGITRRSSSDLTASGATVTAPAGYYENAASASVSSGTEGTPTATKGTVASHAVSVTPSVTNSAGYISGGTHSGTAVTVSASELVSGSQTITDNDTYDVTNLAEVVVNVSGGGGGTVTVGTKTATLSAVASSISFTGLSGNPTSFVVTSSADQSTGGDKVVGVVYDGTDVIGQTITTQVTYDGSGFSKSYSNGTLTITNTGAEFQANEYKLVYTYDGSSSDIHTANVQVGSGATSITFSGLSGRPIYFSCIFKSDFSTSSGYQRVIEVVNDGTSTYGMEMDSSAKAATHWSYTYSGGSLTISSQGTNAGGYFHQPGYYQLTYAVDDSAPAYQAKTGVGASTSSQTIYPDTGYDALESVQINAVSQTNLTAANIKSGTTVTISNGTSNLWSVTGTYSGGGGGSASVATTTWTNSSTSTVSHTFSSLLGTPKAAFLRCTAQLTRSSSNTYYYIADICWDGTNAYGNYHLRSNGSYNNVATDAASGFNVTTGTNSITFSSDASSRSSAPGSFYNGSYELTYVY